MPSGEHSTHSGIHDRELVTEKDANGWFAITPAATKEVRVKIERERAAKIVAFPVVAA